MLEGAERTAISEHVTKEEQDFWVLESHHRAAKAAQEGLLSDIQVSVAGSCKDEGIRASMSQKLMDRLPYLLPGGCAINAANACLMHDGAAFVALCSEEYGKRHNLIPAAVLRFGTAVGGDPLMSPKTAVLAVEKLLKKTGLIYDQVDAFEVNEAFAVIDVLFDRAFPGNAGTLQPVWRRAGLWTSLWSFRSTAYPASFKIPGILRRALWHLCCSGSRRHWQRNFAGMQIKPADLEEGKVNDEKLSGNGAVGGAGPGGPDFF